ncbi:MAG: PQQ-dependent sugar dehydrogenase [Pseudomonadales bacterium]
MLRALLLLTLTVAIDATAATADADPGVTGYRVDTIAEGLSEPWGLAFLPDGGLLVTERTGTLRRVRPDGSLSDPLAGVPPVYFAGQGGLLDVVLDPDFAANRLVYLSYAHGDLTANATRVARATLGEAGLDNLQVIFTVAPTKDTAQHYGGAMAFLGDGTLLLTTGDGFDYREQAQNRAAMLGKTIRIAADGSVPADNPYVDANDAAAEVWTYGHRNPQGLVVDPASGRVYQHEHGPRGGDELNLLVPGRNYGWPAITYGMDYSGAYVSPFRELPGMEQPLIYWVPSIAPSGLAIYRGSAFPQWQGDLFIGALVDRELRRVDMENGAVMGQQSLLGELGERIRNVEVGPDDFLYVITDGPEGRILRLSPAT